jgi:hypothetical protein
MLRLLGVVLKVASLNDDGRIDLAVVESAIDNEGVRVMLATGNPDIPFESPRPRRPVGRLPRFGVPYDDNPDKQVEAIVVANAGSGTVTKGKWCRAIRHGRGSVAASQAACRGLTQAGYLAQSAQELLLVPLSAIEFSEFGEGLIELF